MKLEMLNFNKLLTAMMPMIFSQFKDMEKIEAFKATIPALEEYFVRNMKGADYLSGTSNPMMIDINCFGMLEKVVMLEGTSEASAYAAMQFQQLAPTIYAWVHRFRANKKFSAHCITLKAYEKKI